MRPRANGMMMGGMSAFTVGASPSPITAAGPWSGSAIGTGVVTVSQLTGPATSLTASWALVSGSGIAAASPSSLATSFSGSPPGENTSVSGTMRCTVTNGFGQVATVDVPVTITAGLAAIAPNVSPAGPGFYTHSNASNFTQGFTASPTCPASTGPWTIAWSAGGGSMSPASGTSSTLTTTPGGVGNNTFSTLRCDVSDGAGRTGVANVSNTVTWT